MKMYEEGEVFKVKTKISRLLSAHFLHCRFFRCLPSAVKKQLLVILKARQIRTKYNHLKDEPVKTILTAN